MTDYIRFVLDRILYLLSNLYTTFVVLSLLFICWLIYFLQGRILFSDLCPCLVEPIIAYIGQVLERLFIQLLLQIILSQDVYVWNAWGYIPSIRNYVLTLGHQHWMIDDAVAAVVDVHSLHVFRLQDFDLYWWRTNDLHGWRTLAQMAVRR